MTFSASARRALVRLWAAVDLPELLVAGPGHRDLVVRVASVQTGHELGALPFGEVLGAVPQQPTYLVERVVLVTSMSELFLLHPASDFVDDGRAELHDVDGVQHLHRVGQRVAQRVGVAAGRVEGGVL